MKLLDSDSYLLRPDTYPKLYFATAKPTTSFKVVKEQNWFF